MFASLALENFRNHRALVLENLPQHVLLCGENGVGKTNLLEALSLFSAGRGLRAAALDDICPLVAEQEGSEQNGFKNGLQNGLQNGFTVRATLQGNQGKGNQGKGNQGKGNQGKGNQGNGNQGKGNQGKGKQQAERATEPDTVLATHFSPTQKRRRIYIDEQEVAQTALREHVSICWLLPQMGSFFTDGIGARRAWLDRLVSRLDPKHESRLAKHAHLLRERLSVLLGYAQAKRPSSSWLDILEQRLAEQAIAVTASRANTILLLNALFQEHDFFADLTRLRLASASQIDQDLIALDSLQAEQRLTERLHAARDKDRQEQRSGEGAHRARLSIENLSLATTRNATSSTAGGGRGVRAELCSCGEQKLMLLALLLGEALLLKGGASKPVPLVLLLDDFPAHLDKRTQARALRVLSLLDSQCFYSATEPFIDYPTSFFSRASLEQGAFSRASFTQNSFTQDSFTQNSFTQDSFFCELFLLESNGVRRKAA